MGGLSTLMLGFAVGAVMGMVFSLLGAGGGIISVPVLLGVFSLPLADATGAGLAVVFAAAITSAVGHARAGRVDRRAVLVLGPTVALGAVGGARLNPLLPEATVAGLFALVLVLATASLFRPRLPGAAPAASLPALLVAGLGLGGLTGLLGVGGGFLLVPALVALAGLPLPRAVGTSTALIALGSLSGGLTSLVARPELANLVLPLAAGAALGSVVGVPLSGRLPERVLRLGFAVLSLVVAAGMAARAAGV